MRDAGRRKRVRGGREEGEGCREEERVRGAGRSKRVRGTGRGKKGELAANAHY